jgi:hypothetical protein
MTNSNNIQIENFLTEKSNKGLNLYMVGLAQKSLITKDKVRFDSTMNLAVQCQKANEFMSTDTFKASAKLEFKENWDKKAFIESVYGISYNYFAKLVQAANFGNEKFKEFNAKCESEGVETERSLAAFILFCKGENESEDKAETIFSLAFKPSEGSNIAVRIDSANIVKTKNTAEDIVSAIAFLEFALANFKAEATSEGAE